MIKIIADGEKVDIHFKCGSKDAIKEAIGLMGSLVHSLAEEFNIKDILLAEELFDATKKYIEWEEKRRNL